MELKEIALEAAKGIQVPLSPEGITYFVPAHLAVELCTRFIAAVDAERGKDAVVWQCRQKGEDWQEWKTLGHKPQGPESPRFQMRPLFLSPTISEGECGCKLVPDYDAIRDAERYRFLRDEENWVDDDPDFAMRPWETLGESSGKEFDSTIDSYMEHRKAMIQAAGVTK